MQCSAGLSEALTVTVAVLCMHYGLALWAALKAQWALRCETRFQATHPSLDALVARWVGVVEVEFGGQRRICHCPVWTHNTCSTS